MAHLTPEEITERVAGLPAAPTDNGSVRALFIRPDNDQREVVDTLHAIAGKGTVGDNYIARGDSRTADGQSNPEKQIAVMNASILDVVADGNEDLWKLAGDQILVDFDLSTRNVPAGTRLSIGSTVLEVSNAPHNGCAKFAERYGMAAGRFVNSDKVERYRGINMMVVQDGDVTVGDSITKLEETGNGSFPPAS